MEVAEPAADPSDAPRRRRTNRRTARRATSVRRDRGAAQASSAPVLKTGAAAADGADAGADDAVGGAQVQMARLLPPSIAEPPSSSRSGSDEIAAARSYRCMKRPASRPASVLASPVPSTQASPVSSTQAGPA